MYNRNFHSRPSNSRTSNRFGSRGPSNSNRLDISKFINKARPTEDTVEIPVLNAFGDFNIHPSLKSNISRHGYVTPTPIQDQAIEPILEGKDLLGIANTGTGKTGAFLIPLINKIITNHNEKVAIIAPTRELAIQIEQEFKELTVNMGIWSVLCIGGTNMYQQRRAFGRYFNVLIGTPGRVKDLIDQKLLNLSSFNSVVLDEVDRMLDMGFIHDVRMLLNLLPTTRQSLFFSATVSGEIMNLIREFSHNVVTISVKTAETAETVDQDIVRVNNPADKLEVLHQLLIQEGFDKVLIFGRTKWGVQKLAEKLSQRGFRSDAIHGNKSQPQRQRALLNFRQNRINVLVATDVAARGLDIPDVTHVINYDLPETYDDYIHRIGRTGRANKSGKALTFVG